jgi:hypothetical protein
LTTKSAEERSEQQCFSETAHCEITLKEITSCPVPIRQSSCNAKLENMYRAVSSAASEAPSARCGDVFLASFEWPSPSPPKTPTSSDATETAKISDKSDGISIYDDSKKNETEITEQLATTQLNSAEEISKRMKRPSSFMSSECTSVLRKSKQENECIQDTKRPCVLASNNLQDIIQCATGDQNQKLIVTSASFPYHVEWVSSSWSKLCGWSCDEVLGRSAAVAPSEQIVQFPNGLSSDNNSSIYTRRT